MNEHTIKGDWKILKGKIKEQWGKLTDDELDQMNGQREQIEGAIQKKYGCAKDEAKKQLDDFLDKNDHH